MIRRAIINTFVALSVISLAGCATQVGKPDSCLSEHKEGLKEGKYINPKTCTDSAGRTPDDPYYGGDSDFGTAGGKGVSYAVSNAWSNSSRGGMAGLNPMPGAGKYIPGTSTYIPIYLDNYNGPGDVQADILGLAPGKQRDLIINQNR